MDGDIQDELSLTLMGVAGILHTFSCMRNDGEMNEPFTNAVWFLANVLDDAKTKLDSMNVERSVKA